MVLMNLIIKGKLKKTLIFPAFAGYISVLLWIRGDCCFGIVNISSSSGFKLLSDCVLLISGRFALRVSGGNG